MLETEIKVRGSFFASKRELVLVGFRQKKLITKTKRKKRGQKVNENIFCRWRRTNEKIKLIFVMN